MGIDGPKSIGFTGKPVRFNLEREKRREIYRNHALALVLSARESLGMIRPIGARFDDREKAAIHKAWEGILELEKSLAIGTPFEGEILRDETVSDAWKC